jgi:hypothetical protein
MADTRNIPRYYFNLQLKKEYWTFYVGVQVPAGARDFALYHRVQTYSGAHPALYPVGTRGSFPGGGGEAAGAWSWPLTYI